MFVFFGHAMYYHPQSLLSVSQSLSQRVDPKSLFVPTRGICTQYDMDKDAFVEGQLEGEGYDAKFVAF